MLCGARSFVLPFGSIPAGGQNRILRSLSAFWPPVFAGEQDVGPPKQRDLGQGLGLGLDDQAGVFTLSDHFAEMNGFQWMTMAASRLNPAMRWVLALAQAVSDFAPDARSGGRP